MRSTGSCGGLQQALTADAAGVVKHAVALAKRRGHVQVTPLHVASTMLSAPSGLLRAACLQSHSHPLQCKALELCFNVALNRLPASSSSSVSLSHHPQHPSISNALVAAFKRAQAHQRRGAAENQQQLLLAATVDLDQLIISILDDPSVSRVMREAGFSSTQVKTNVEKTVSSSCSSELSSLQKENRQISSQIVVAPISSEPSRNDDVGIIVENLLKRKRKHLVIVGESISSIETTVKEVMDRVDKGNVPVELRGVKFVSIPPLCSFCNLHRDLVEKKMAELGCLVRSLVRKGVVLYLGDLNWVSEYRVNSIEHERSYYCSVEHMIMELGRLAYEINADDDRNGRFWLMGIATMETYMRCRTGEHSLETVWGLHPVTVPSNTMGLTLVSPSGDDYNEARREREEYGSTDLCNDCSSKFEAEARNMKSRSTCHSNEPTTSSKLPPWMTNDTRACNNNDQINCESMRELSEKWNSYCSSAHKQLTLSSASPSSSSSCFSFDRQNPNYPQQTRFHLPEPVWGHPKRVFSSNPGSYPSSHSSSDVVMDAGYVQKYKEFNAQNLNTLCDALEKKVPWQLDIIPEIAGTVLQCRSRMLRRKDENNGIDKVKEETWLLFLGQDAQAKETISRELAKVVFGSYSNFASIGSTSSTSSEAWDLLDDHHKKRVMRDEESSNRYVERFAQAVSNDPHRVFFLEDLEEVDRCSRMAIKEAIERGRISRGDGEDEVDFCDAIVVLSCERFGSGSGSPACSPSSKQKMEIDEEERIPNCMSLDLNISFDDDDGVVSGSIDETGILDSVDRSVVFKPQEM